MNPQPVSISAARRRSWGLFGSLPIKGRGVLVISSEPAELLALSDRILLMAGGRIVREISSEEIEAWAEGPTDTTHRISLMETGLQVAIQEANA